MLNQEMRTVTMNRADMCRIRTALRGVRRGMAARR